MNIAPLPNAPGTLTFGTHTRTHTVELSPSMEAPCLFRVEVVHHRDPDLMRIDGPHDAPALARAIDQAVRLYDHSTNSVKTDGYLVEEPYVFMVEAKGMRYSSDSHRFGNEPKYQVEMRMTMLRGPRTEPQAPPADQPWTPERIAAVMAKTAKHPVKAATDEVRERDAAMPYVAIAAMNTVPLCTPFPTLQAAIEGCMMDMENGVCYPLGVLVDGTLHYWQWATLLDRTRDESITVALEHCAMLGITVTEVGDKLPQQWTK